MFFLEIIAYMPDLQKKHKLKDFICLSRSKPHTFEKKKNNPKVFNVDLTLL